MSVSTIKQRVFGKPIPTDAEEEHKVSVPIALALLASDNFSSVAYASQEILWVLAVASMYGSYNYAQPITWAIIGLIGVIAISYRQTLFAYPDGAGAMVVTRDNLGDFPAAIAAGSLLMDYILTVAVSISDGVQNIVSIAPELYDYRVWIAVPVVMAMALVNGRGLKESGRLFAVPTYYFLAMLGITIIVGFYKMMTGTLDVITHVQMEETIANTIASGGVLVSASLILRAFSSGCAAVTGIEAVSDGILAFKEPRSKHASIALLIMASILAVSFASVTNLALAVQAVPSERVAVIPQIAMATFGDIGFGHVLVTMVSISVTTILIMAANTAFADFPRSAAYAAGANFLPRQFAKKGDRLVHDVGLVTLTTASCLIIIAFKAEVNSLIPLYAIGVFASLTLSQLGMVKRWLKVSKIKPGEEFKTLYSTLTHDPKWLSKLSINAFGATICAIVTGIFAVTKFMHGAWLVLLIIPILISLFWSIRSHYAHTADQLRVNISTDSAPAIPSYHKVKVLLIQSINQITLHMLQDAMSTNTPWIAVHYGIDEQITKLNQERWHILQTSVLPRRIPDLIVYQDTYRNFPEPLINLLKEISLGISSEAQIAAILESFTKIDEQMPIMIEIVIGRLEPHGLARVLHGGTHEALEKVAAESEGLVTIKEIPFVIQ